MKVALVAFAALLACVSVEACDSESGNVKVCNQIAKALDKYADDSNALNIGPNNPDDDRNYFAYAAFAIYQLKNASPSAPPALKLVVQQLEASISRSATDVSNLNFAAYAKESYVAYGLTTRIETVCKGLESPTESKPAATKTKSKTAGG